MTPKSARVILQASALFAFLGAGFWLHALLMSASPGVRTTLSASRTAPATSTAPLIPRTDRCRLGKKLATRIAPPDGRRSAPWTLIRQYCW